MMMTTRKIEINTSLDSFKLHIVLDKSSDITTISSPLHRSMKPSDSPVHDCIKANHETLVKEDVDFQGMYYCDDGDFENEDEKPGHSYFIRVVDSELCHLTTSRNNKKAILSIGNEARANIL
jgi:hypothetical protein